MESDDFASECLKERQVIQKQGVQPITTRLERDNDCKNSFSNADYFLQGAKELINGNVPYLVFTVGFFAMEHAANGLIALKGYKVIEHKCAQVFLSRVLKRDDMAKSLSRAYNKRIAFNYRYNLSSYADKTEAEEFLNGEVVPFVDEMKKLAGVAL